MPGTTCKHRRWIYCSASGGAALAMAFGAPNAVFAQEQTTNYSIAAQPLSSGLLELARQARISILAPPALVANKPGKAVHGSLSLREALKSMLDGSGLEAQFVNPNAVRIVAAAERSGAQSSASTAAVDELSELVVTGTHIKGQEPIGAHVTTLDRREIIDTGRVSMTELLKVIPQIQTIGTVEGARTGRGQGEISNDGAGSSVNLRGLGPESTLVLVNGRRVAPSAGGAFVDISQIPVSAVETVAVLPDGASALYGSDAVGGVVNFVLRKRYDGADTSLHYGLGDDFHEYTVGQTLGKTWSSGSILLSYEYYSRTHLASIKRDYARSDLTAFGGDNFILTSGAALYAGNPGTVMVGGAPYAAIPKGQNGQGLTAGDLLVGQTNQTDPQLAADLQPSQKRNSLVASFEQELTPHVRFFVDGLYSTREFVTKNRADTAAVVVGPDSPFFISGIPGSPDADTVRYSFFRDFDNRNEGRSTNYTVTGGFDFDLPYRWTAEVYGSRGEDKLDNRGLGVVNTARLAVAAGTPGAAAVRPDGLPYFNPFGDGSYTSPQTLAYVEGATRNQQRYSLTSFAVSATGPLFTLPGGEVRMAVGFDERVERYKSERVDDTSSLTPVNVTDLSDSSFGIGSFRRSITAGYGELSVPIFGPTNAAPFLKRLDISLAVRGEHYSDFGSTVDPKIGLVWQPVDGLSLRGSWGTSFRAPRLVELDETANAYYIRNFPNAAAVPGAPSTFPTPGNSWVIYLADAGNSRLKPETAKTYSLGADFKPAFLPGFKASLTYYHIDYDNRILVPSEPELLSALAGSGTPGIVLGLHPSQAVLDAIYANKAGSVGLPSGLFKDSGFVNFYLPGFPSNQLPAQYIYAIVHVGLSNYGQVLTDGWDLSASYQFRNHLGDFEIGGAATFVTTYKIRHGDGDLVDYLDTMSNPVGVRGRMTASWSRGPLNLQMAVNHTGGYLNPYGNQQVSSWNTVDLHFGYRLGKSLQVVDGMLATIDVENLFDADPPFVNNQSISIGYDPEMATPRGRVIGFTLRKTW